MTLRDMAYMVEIAKEKSITKAANRLFVAQPALSQCLQKVEKELGVTVFLRTSSGVAVTEEGRCFLSFAENTLKENKNMQRRLNDIKDTHGKEVCLGFTGTQATYVLPYFLPQFKAKYPDVEVTLIEDSSHSIEEKLISGEVDVGIIHPPLIQQALECFEISHDDLVIIPRSNSRYQQHIYYREGDQRPYLNLDFLRDEPLALTASNQRSRMICDEVFRRAGISPCIKLVVKNLITLDALAQVDYATVILPRKQMSAGLNRHSFFYIDPKYAAYYPFYAGVYQETYHSLATENLLKLLRELSGTF